MADYWDDDLEGLDELEQEQEQEPDDIHDTDSLEADEVEPSSKRAGRAEFAMPDECVEQMGDFARPVVPRSTKQLDAMLVDVELTYGRLDWPSLDCAGVDHSPVIPIDDDAGDGPGKRKYTPSSKFTTVMVPVVKLYMVTMEGASVSLDVYGFYPTFRLRIISGTMRETTVARLCKYIEAVLSKGGKIMPGRPRQIVSAKIVEGYPAYPYTPDYVSFIEFRLANPRNVRVLAEHFAEVPVLDDTAGGSMQVLPYSGEDPLTQFMVQAGLCGFGWLRASNLVDPKERQLSYLCPSASANGDDDDMGSDPIFRSFGDASKVSTCSAHYITNAYSLHPLPEIEAIAPTRVLSLDIECLKEEGIPDPKKNSIIVIGVIASIATNGVFTEDAACACDCARSCGASASSSTCSCSEGLDHQPKTKANHKIVFTWAHGPVDPIPRVDKQFVFSHESDMLAAFGAFVSIFDPDVYIGHNIVGFDIPFIVTRADAIGVDISSEMGRRSISAASGKWTAPKEIVRVRKNGEVRKSLRADTPGRIQLDTLTQMQGLSKESSYKLGSLAAKWLEDSKDDVGYNMIAPLWKRSPQTRQRLCEYCLKDVELSLGLAKYKRFEMLLSAIMMARETRVPAGRLLRSGNQEKVKTLVLHQAVHPNFDPEDRPVYFPFEIPKSRDKKDKFDGATVLSPTRGYSDAAHPVAVGDFKSLYPSVMLCRNIDYSTVYIPHMLDPKYGVPKHETAPKVGTKFVAAEHRVGLLPRILKHLLDSRDKAKTMMKKATDPSDKKRYDSKQLQLKIVANSVYGVLSASGGWFVRIEMGASVTAWGRTMIDQARTIAMAPPFNADIIYGDTDSIMMKYSDCDTVEKAFVKLKEVCVAVTKTFPSPVELQPEKVYSPHLQLGKKRYVGLCHIMGEKPKIDSKGVESNRLDNCPLVRRMMKEVFEYLFVRNDLQGALKFVRDTAIDLIQGRIEMAELVVTKSVSKDNYAGKMTHIEVAKRMKARDPSYMFAPGERIPYVITLPENKGPINHGGSKSGRPYDTKLHEQAEDPLWCITHDMQIDTMYYLENQLSGPLARIFMWYIGDKNHIAMIHTMEDRLHEPGRSALECAQINHDIDKEIKKMTLAVATKLLGPLAFLNVPRSKPRLSGPISRFITKVSKKLTPEEEEAKLAKAVELHEKLTQFRAVCIKCRGHEDFTIQCQQRDCPNLFRLAQTNRDIEDLAN